MRNQLQQNAGQRTSKKVKETYLVDALSFTEAEANIIKSMQPFSRDDLSVEAIKKIPESSVINYSDSIDKIYKAKIKIVNLNEKTEKEQTTIYRLLVNSPSVDKAHESIVAYMKDSISDYEISNIDETKVMDIFRHE